MSPTGNIDVAAKAMIEEIIRVCAARLGADATSAPADVPAASGWTLTVPVTGAAEGRLVIWFDRASAAAYVRTVAGKLQHDRLDFRIPCVDGYRRS